MPQVCRPKFLAIHNTNLPGHAGWISAHLKRQVNSPWYELMNGTLDVSSHVCCDVGGGEGKGENGMNKASL